jgi:radical SAM protein with 4Fe4S-binding SPASM domain
MIKKLIGKNSPIESPQIQETIGILSKPIQPLEAAVFQEFVPDFLGIIPTRGCNSKCLYCDFGAEKADKTRMEYSIAVTAVDWFVATQAAAGKEIVSIQFFGGEPMVATDVVQTVIHRMRLAARKEKIYPTFDISTNGQFSEEWARFLGDYFKSVTLSIDGQAAYQEKTRPRKDGKGSSAFAENTARIISSSNADLYCRCCVTSDNQDHMNDITAWLCEEFDPTGINFEVMQPTVRTEKFKLKPPNPYIFAKNFITSRRTAKSYGIKTVYASDFSDEPQRTSCPVGKDAIIVSPDGTLTGCYLLPERWEEKGINLDFGRIVNSEVKLNYNNINIIRKMVMHKPLCTNCFCRWHCAGGCHVGTTYPDCPEEYNDFCVQTRIITAATILEGMGLSDEIENLCGDLNHMKKLALNKTDLLGNFSVK